MAYAVYILSGYLHFVLCAGQADVEWTFNTGGSNTRPRSIHVGTPTLSSDGKTLFVGNGPIYPVRIYRTLCCTL